MAQGPTVAFGEPWRLVSWPGSVCVESQSSVQGIFVKSVRGITHRHVIQLMVVRAPHRVCEVVVLSNHANMLVRIIGEVLPPEERIPLDQILAPELDVDVFALRRRGQQLLRHGDGLAIKVLAQRYPRELEKCWHDIRVRRGERLHRTLGHARSADEEGDVDVFFDIAAFAGWEAVLADVVAVVSCVDQVCIVEDGGVGGQPRDDGVDQLVDGLERLEPLAVPVVVVVDLALVELAEGFEVGCCAGLGSLLALQLSILECNLRCLG
jgi:hypothetical protein